MSADVGTTVPLLLGLQLATGGGGTALVSGTMSVPITMVDAGIISSANAADIGTTFPLALGANLETNGATNYTTTSGTMAVPITMVAGNLVLSADPADVGITYPLALGMLLQTTGYTMVSGTMSVPINIASAEAFEITDGGGIGPIAPAYTRHARKRAVYDTGIYAEDERMIQEMIHALFQLETFGG